MPLESKKLLNNNNFKNSFFFLNAVSIFTDHLLVSKEAQAIIGGVVGFWGGVFGMGSVYLLVVCLRRIRKQVQNQRNNGPMLIDKVSNNCIKFLSSFADFSILLTYFCKKKKSILKCADVFLLIAKLIIREIANVVHVVTVI